MTDDLDDLLSDKPAPVSRVSDATRKRLDEARLARQGLGPKAYSDDEHEATEQVLAQGKSPDTSTLRRPMTVTNIATLLGKEPRRTVGLLSKCPRAGTVQAGRHAGQPMYDLKDAINYLATPSAESIEVWIRAQSPATLPPFIHKAFWEAMRMKAKVLYEAGDLWHTTDVQRVFGETAKTIKESMMLWVEKLPGVQQMSTEQYEAFRDQVQQLQTDIHRLMLEEPSERNRVRSYAGDIEEMVNEAHIEDEGDE